jgi:hypothetical protein
VSDRMLTAQVNDDRTCRSWFCLSRSSLDLSGRWGGACSGLSDHGMLATVERTSGRSGAMSGHHGRASDHHLSETRAQSTISD